MPVLNYRGVKPQKIRRIILVGNLFFFLGKFQFQLKTSKTKTQFAGVRTAGKRFQQSESGRGIAGQYTDNASVANNRGALCLAVEEWSRTVFRFVFAFRASFLFSLRVE